MRGRGGGFSKGEEEGFTAPLRWRLIAVITVLDMQQAQKFRQHSFLFYIAKDGIREDNVRYGKKPLFS